MALPVEAPGFVNRTDVVWSGVGKVNAAIAAERAIREGATSIVNFGTAGSISVRPGLYRVTRLVQRDMLCQPLGFAAGVTPYDREDSEIKLTGSGIACGTGDSFVSGDQLAVTCDIVDMEAWAIARVCQRHGVEFRCWKWITDSADLGAAEDWQQLVAQGESAYRAILMDIENGL